MGVDVQGKVTLDDVISEVAPLDPTIEARAEARLDSLTKPRGSLGRLEEFAKRYVAITGNLRPKVGRKTVFTFAADHGVAAEGVSAYPAEVTPQMVLNFLSGGAGINVLARHAGADVVVVDIGVNFDFGSAEGLVSKKVVHGTRNMAKGPAMTRDEALAALEVGAGLAREHAKPGSIFGTGEMGIANTTAASAIAAVLTDTPVEEVTGRGTGIDDASLAHKIEVIKTAIETNSPDAADPIDVLAKVGGAEVAGIAGLCLGAASRRVPVVVDGFISTAGALVAAKICPGVSDYLFASHNSVERGHKVMNSHLGLLPMLDLGLRLGEGTGSALGISLLEAGVRIYNEMATFGEAGVSEEG